MTLIIESSLIKLLLCFFMLLDSSHSEQVDVYLPLSSAPGTLIGDLDTLSSRDLVPISRGPYYIEPDPDRNKVNLTMSMLMLYVQPSSESTYSLTISHATGILSLSIHFTSNKDYYRPFVSPDILKETLVESTPPGATIHSFTCKDYQRNKTLSHLLKLEFYLPKMNGLFRLTSSGVLQVNSVLNALDTPFIPLLVSCQDPRAPYHPFHAAVAINITQTDSAVVACTSPLVFDLCEDTPPGHISDIRCYHPSYFFSFNLTYTLSNPNFAEEDGQLRLTSSLNYEENTSINFTIAVTDQFNTILTDTIAVTVNVLPVNEFTPSLTRAEFRVSEDVQIPHSFQLEASDPDSGSHGEIAFRLVNPSSGIPFSVGADGLVRVSSPLDFESRSDFLVEVEVADKLDPAGAVCDGGVKTSVSQIRVIINDVNEQPSFVSTSYEINLLETIALNSVVGSVVCIDPDNSNVDNGDISYSLVTSSIAFSIDSSGQLTLRTQLDFTEVAGYSFLVICVDQGLSPLQDTAQVNLPVIPFIEFDDSLYSAQIAENAGVGTFIVEVMLSLSSITSHNFVTKSFSITSDTSNGAIVLDSGTGVTALGVLLPRGVANSQYQLTIQATAQLLSKDGSTKIASAATTLVVSILNATTLLFAEIYSVNVSENVRGVELVTIVAFNSLTGSSNDIIYSLLTPSTVFSLDNITGVLELTSSLNRELQRVHLIPVTAHDRFNASIQASTDITLTVLDLNDVTPFCVSFTQRYITGNSFPALTPLTPPLNCNDIDAESPNNLIAYSLLGGSTLANITIDSSTGEILGLGNLDVGLYDYTVVVSDLGVDPAPLNTTEIVRIHVTENNYHPQFVNTPSFIELPENHTLSTVVQVNVSDKDTGPPGDVSLSYEVISPSEDIFSLDSNTGVFALLGSLDYERAREYVIVFNATDNGRPRKSNSTALRIIVLNLNDESPECEPIETLRLDFDNHYPDFLFQLLCSDPDNQTDLLFYSIDPLSNATGYFSVSGKGAVSTISSFQGLSNFSFPVYLPIPITIGENNSLLFTSLVIYVLVGESGVSFEFAPLIPAPTPEDAPLGTLIATFTAIHTPNQSSLLTSYSIYSVTPYEEFSIGADTGELRVGGDLDFEEVREYNITIRTVDNAFYSNLRLFQTTIRVLDVCDNPPTISATPPTVQINQSAFSHSSKVIRSFPCSDRDSGANGEIFCFVASVSPNLGVPFFSMSGCDLMLDRDLNGTCVATFDLVINCTDLCDVISLRTVRSFPFSVGVEFENLNNPMPIVGYYPRSINISENQLTPQLISTSSLHFTDLDCEPFNRTFFTVTSSLPGYLFSDRGDIYLNNSIDFDEDLLLISQSHRVTSSVRVFDCAGLLPSCEGTGPPNTVTVQFVDLNDNRPVCQKYIASISIPETTVTGSTFPTSIICDDLDLSHDSSGVDSSHSLVYFEINNTDASVKDIFQVLSITADPNKHSVELNVRVLQALDHENTSHYVLNIKVFDGGSPPMDSEYGIILTILVRNINEHGPFYSATSLTLHIVENFNISSAVYNATAMDLDNPPEHLSLYSLTVAPNEKFRIDNTSALISLASTLDRETVSSYEMQVTATEIASPSNRTATLNISVVVTDFNDNPPSLTLPPTSIQIPQSVSSGVIHTFPCIDRDEGLNGMFDCDVTSPVFEGVRLFRFSVVSQLCTLSIEGNPVPNCSVPLNHDLTINCTDRGSPSISDSFPVSVLVSLENLQTPVVQNAPIIFNLSESTPLLHVIGELSTYVSDNDCGNFGVLSYSLENQSPNPPLYVMLTAEGVLSLINTLDFDDPIFGSPPTLTLEILAQDNQGSASYREVRFNATISITDSNDNPPTCTDSSIDISVVEGSLATQTFSIICYDIDSAQNGELSTTFLSNHSLLFVFERSFLNSSHSRVSITPIQPLDFESIESYTVLVSITDRGFPQLASNLTVNIYVENINDNTPFFVNPPPILSITENVPSAFLATISARDLDKGRFGDLSYALITARYDSTSMGFVDISQGNTSQFELGVHTGDLYQIAIIDYETDVIFHFGVLATDGGSPPITNKTYFTITVENVNEFSPQFETPASASLLQGAVSGATVAFINVSDSDRDDGFNCYISSDSIPSSIVSSIFVLNLTEVGFAITLQLPIVCNDALLYQFEIVCNDTGLPSRSNSTHYSVSITPQNLNVPVPSSTQVSLTVVENEALGFVIFDVSSLLTDPDCAMLGSYRYSILAQFPLGVRYFDLDPDNGEVSVNATIDYESVPTIEVRIQVEDDLLSAGLTPINDVIRLTLTVSDINDNPPECLYTNDDLNLPEAMSPINFTTRIVCTDRDTFTNMTAMLLNTENISNFGVEMVPVMNTDNVLVLHVLADLDFEQVVNYTLQVLIQDPTNPSFNQSVTLSIEVYAVNEFDPVIDSHPLVYVEENNLVGIVIANITVQHSDLNESLIFYITQNYPYVAEIDSVTGAISLNTSLDRENPEHNIQHTVTVHVNDTGVPPRSSIPVPFQFALIDLNDNSVEISYKDNDSYFEILQSQSDGIVANLSCTDADFFVNALFSCSISTPTNPLNNGQPVFAVSHGTEGPDCLILALRTPPCNEELRYDLTLICDNTQTLSPGATSFDFAVHIVPQNLSSPFLSKKVFPISVTISETDTKNFPIIIQKTVNITDGVEDSDCGNFGQIVFIIDVAQSNNLEYISLDNKTGVLTIISEVDKEVLKAQTGSRRIHIIVDILDNNGEPGYRRFPSTSLISIGILDVDDEPPECTRTNFSLTFLDSDNTAFRLVNIPGSDFQCTDPDTCTFTNFQTTSTNNLFTILSGNSGTCNTSEVRTGEFSIVHFGNADLETIQQTEWDIVITVTDGKTGPNHSTFVYVHIELIDLNEFPIAFSQPSYELVLNATSPIGLLDLTVTATDGDFTSEIRYSSADTIFSVDPISGQLLLTQTLNSTNQTFFQVTITATDLASSQTDSVILSVTINHPPIFIKPVLQQYCTNSTDTFLALPYLDSNLDASQDVLVFFLSPHTNPTLNIANSSTQVEIAASDPSLFDQTIPSQYTITVRDSTGLTDSFTFNLTKCRNVTRRDVSPFRSKRAIIKTLHFSQLVVEVYLPLVFPPGNSLMSQLCLPANPQAIDYTLRTANHTDWPFAMNATSGVITVEEVLGRLVYQLVLACNNSLHHDIASYIVIVLAESQYTPNFLEDSYTFSIPENTPVATIFGAVTARTERMLQISYAVTGVNFWIDPANGSISLADSLDFETLTSHTFSVTATNEAIFSIKPSSTVTVTISVTDVNDNPPIFINAPYHADILIPKTSFLPIGLVIAQAKCVDNDLDETNQIVYSLAEPHPIYAIQSSNGYIFIASDPHLLNLAYIEVFDILCTDTAHIPSPARDTAQLHTHPSRQLPPTCPSLAEFDLVWPEIAINSSNTVLCPGTPEVAFRFCSLGGDWLYPDMSNCQSYPFIPNLPVPVSVPEANCYDFFTQYMLNLVKINNNIGDVSEGKLHLAGDIKLAMEYFIAAEELFTCPGISNSEFDSLARLIIASTDEFTKSHFSNVWLTLTQQLQRNLSQQLFYILHHLSHRLLSPHANDINSVATLTYTHIATELHPNHSSTVSNTYMLQAVHTSVIAFSPCYLQAVSGELGLSYLNDSARVSGYLPSSESEGVVRDSVSTSLVGVYSSNYSDIGQDCRVVITFVTREGSEKHRCALWEFSTGSMGSWNLDACRIASQFEDRINCSCKGQGIVTVIGTTPPPVFPHCFPLPDFAAFIMFVLSSSVIVICVLISIAGNIRTYRKDYKNPSLYFKLHMLAFLCLAEVANFIGIIVIPYENVCRIISVVIHILFVFVFCWILMFATFHLTRFLLPKKEKYINRFSICLFFAGYAIPLSLLAVSLIDLDLYGVVAPPDTSRCRYLYCWVSSQSDTSFPVIQFLCSALPLMLTQFVMSVPLFLHAFIPGPALDLNKPKRPLFNTKLAPSYFYSETIPGFILVYLIGLHYAFLSTAYDGILFATFSLIFSLLTSALLFTYHTGIISSLTRKGSRPYVMSPKRKQTEFVVAEDYETRLVTRQHERVNWAFLNVQEERFYEEGRQLGAHFNIAKPTPTESLASLDLDL